MHGRRPDLEEGVIPKRKFRLLVIVNLMPLHHMYGAVPLHRIVVERQPGLHLWVHQCPLDGSNDVHLSGGNPLSKHKLEAVHGLEFQVLLFW